MRKYCVVLRTLAAETCGLPVPQGYVFYPGYDTTAQSGGCVNYDQQAGYTLQSALNETRSVFFSNCNGWPDCVAVTYLASNQTVSVNVGTHSY